MSNPLRAKADTQLTTRSMESGKVIRTAKSANRRQTDTVVWWLFRLAFCALTIAFIFGIANVWASPAVVVKSKTNASDAQPAKTSAEDLQAEVSTMDRDVASQEKVFTAEKDELAHLNDATKFLMTATGIFAFLLGLASWKTLEDQRTAASENLKLQMQNIALQFAKTIDESNASLESVTRLRDEVQRDFPMFGRMRSNFARILHGLQSACERLQPDDDTYKSLHWDEEQRILFYESAITTSLLLDTKDHDKQLSEIYRLLGVFYGSRYCSTRKDSTKDSPRMDLDRSRYYFDRSIDLDPKNYLSYMHAGLFTQYYDDDELERASIDYFQRASAIGEDFQKPLLSIAMIELDGFGDPDRALRTLEQAKRRPKYDVDLDSPEPEYISYLESYALCLKAEKVAGDLMLEILMKALGKFAVGVQKDTPKMKEIFDADIDVFSRAFGKVPSLIPEFSALASKLTDAASNT